MTMMNVYQAFFSLNADTKDADFALALQSYMSYLQEQGDLKRASFALQTGSRIKGVERISPHYGV